MPTVDQYLEDHLRRGWRIIPLIPRTKRPIDRMWQNVERSDDEIRAMWANDPTLNIGWRITGEWVDVDLDTITAIRLAPHFLPRTGLIFGRRGKPKSHWIYRVTGAPPKYTKFSSTPDTGLSGTIAEMRVDGFQTAIPGSVHPSGEPIEWASSVRPTSEAATVDWVELLKAMRHLAAACQLSAIWPRGSRHDTTLALTGALARAGWSADDVWLFIKPVLEDAGENPDEISVDRHRAVFDTVANMASRPTTGWPTLERLTAPDAVKRIRGWLIGSDAARHDYTDVGNAQRLMDAFGEEIRYCPEKRSWFYWNQRHWREDPDQSRVENLFVQVTDIMEDQELPALRQSLRDEEEGDEETPASKKIARFVAHIKGSRSSSKIRAAVQVARTILELQISVADLDADPYLLNVENGTLDLQTGGLKRHEKSDYITRMAGCSWSPGARNQDWEIFLRRSTEGNPELGAYLQLLAGYTLFHGNPSERFMIVHGPAGSGKSTFVEALAETLGTYTATLDPASLKNEGEAGQARSDLVQLRGVRMVRTNEMDIGQRWSAALVKRLTGGDTVSAREIYQSTISFLPGFKMWMSTNARPRVNDTSDGYWRRLIEIPFSHMVTGDEFDERLKDRIKRHGKEAILAWAFQGFQRYEMQGLGAPPAVVEEAIQEYRESMDPIAQFISECCETDPEHFVSSGALYGGYRSWCQSMNQRAISAATFKQNIERRGYEWRRTRAANGYGGIRLIPQVMMTGMDPFAVPTAGRNGDRN